MGFNVRRMLDGRSAQLLEGFFMEKNARIEVWLHYTLSFVGGYMCIYALLARTMLGAGQTGNMVYLIWGILGRNFYDVVVRMGALAVYIVAIVLTIWLPRRFSIGLKSWCILVDAAVVLLLGFLPENMEPYVGLYPIFFSTAFQWCSFKGAGGYNCSTTFSTNTLRQFVAGIAEFCMTKDRAHLNRAKFYAASLFWFHAAAAAGFFCWKLFRIQSIWFNMIPVLCAAGLLAAESGWAPWRVRSFTASAETVLDGDAAGPEKAA